MHYCVIARDSDMIVFEILMNKELNVRQLKSEAMDFITQKESENELIIKKMNTSMSSSRSQDLESNEQESQFWSEPLKRITTSVELNLLLQTGVFFGIITDLNFDKEKAKRFLTSLHTEMVKLYKGNVIVVGRKADNSLYNATLSTFEDDGGAYDQKDAAGFIKIQALRLRTRGTQRGPPDM